MSNSQNKANAASRGGGYSNLHASASENNKWAKNGYGDGGVRVKLQTGKFSKEESELVKTAIQQYCAAKQISVSRLCSECDHKAE